MEVGEVDSRLTYRGYMRSIAKQCNAVPEAGATKGYSKYTRTPLTLHNVATLMYHIVLTLASRRRGMEERHSRCVPHGRRSRRSLSSILTT